MNAAFPALVVFARLPGVMPVPANGGAPDFATMGRVSGAAWLAPE